MPPSTAAILTPMSSLSPCCSSSCECLVCPSILTSVYVVFSVIVVVVSRATLSISFPLVVVYFTFSIRIVCIHFYRLYHVCRYPSLPSHGHRSFQSPWAALGQCRTTTTTRCIGQCLFHSSASLCPLPDTKAICDPLPVKIHSPFQQTSSEVSLKTWWVSGLIFSSSHLSASYESRPKTQSTSQISFEHWEQSAISEILEGLQGTRKFPIFLGKSSKRDQKFMSTSRHHYHFRSSSRQNPQPFRQTSSEVSLKTWWVSGLIFSSLGLVWK
jgi:hypothetical protein